MTDWFLIPGAIVGVFLVGVAFGTGWHGGIILGSKLFGPATKTVKADYTLREAPHD